MTETITLKGLRTRRDRIVNKWLNDSPKAPSKGGYSQLTGGYSTSKRDLMRACTAELKNLNEVAKAYNFEQLWDFDEEDVTLPGKKA